jgi:hypothetical protein
MSPDELRTSLIAANARGDIQAQEAAVRAFAQAQLRATLAAFLPWLRRRLAHHAAGWRQRA